MGKILVIGVTGTTGGAVADELKARGVPYVAAVHSEEKAENMASQGVETVVMDLGDSASIKKALDGISKAYSMSPSSLNMVQHGLNFIEVAAEAGLEHVVRLSGLVADSSQTITLGRWHRQVEVALEGSGIPYTLVRPNSFMQNYDLYLQSVPVENAFYLPQGDGKVSLIDVRDVAAMIVEFLTGNGHEGKAYNLTGPEALSNYDIADTLSKVIGRKINYVDVPEPTALEDMVNGGMPEVRAEAMVELFAFYKGGYGSMVLPTVNEVLGREPILFEQFAADYRFRI